MTILFSGKTSDLINGIVQPIHQVAQTLTSLEKNNRTRELLEESNNDQAKRAPNYTKHEKMIHPGKPDVIGKGEEKKQSGNSFQIQEKIGSKDTRKANSESITSYSSANLVRKGNAEKTGNVHYTGEDKNSQLSAPDLERPLPNMPQENNINSKYSSPNNPNQTWPQSLPSRHQARVIVASANPETDPGYLGGTGRDTKNESFSPIQVNQDQNSFRPEQNSPFADKFDQVSGLQQQKKVNTYAENRGVRTYPNQNPNPNPHHDTQKIKPDINQRGAELSLQKKEHSIISLSPSLGLPIEKNTNNNRGIPNSLAQDHSDESLQRSSPVQINLENGAHAPQAITNAVYEIAERFNSQTEKNINRTITINVHMHSSVNNQIPNREDLEDALVDILSTEARKQGLDI